MAGNKTLTQHSLDVGRKCALSPKD